MSVDAGHEETNEVLKELEKKLNRMYTRASHNAEGKFRKYMEDFERKDAQHQADVTSGKWSQEEYENWRKNQLLYAGHLNQIRDTISKDLQNVDKIAIQTVRDKQPEVYAINHNYGTYQIEHDAGIDTSYELYDHSTVERLMRDDPQLLPKPSAKRQREIDASDFKWNQDKLTSAFTASIVAGDSIPNMARRISGVAAMDANAAVRNARTMTTGAQNAGRVDSYKRAGRMGIGVTKEWMATLDGRTRDSHRELDGEKVKVDEKFSNGLRFPGDPEGPAREVYNCRCTLIAVVDGIDPGAFDKSDTLRRSLENQSLTYEEWKKGHKKRTAVAKSTVIQGRDISSTWSRRPDDFSFEIEDVMNAQGFDGKPRVVGHEEFNKAVKAANDGQGFVAQRTYSAPDKETLEAYQDQLYDGKWYVDCSTGGAQYGQGMYCAADYTGKVTDGIKEEMKHYADLGMKRQGNPQEAYANTLYTKEIESVELPFPARYRDAFTDKAGITDLWVDKKSEEMQYVDKWVTGHPEEAKSLKAKLEKASDIGSEKGMKIQSMSKAEFEKEYPNALPGYKTETLTLDPSAKIIKYDDIPKLRSRAIEDAKAKHKQILKDNGWDEFDDEFDAEKKRWHNEESHIENMDDGALAALYGYDAINAEGHGKSGSYTVVLNRTKCIFLKE